MLKTDDEAARRKKTDEPSPDDAQKDEDPPKLVPVGQEKDGTSFIAAADDEVRTSKGVRTLLKGTILILSRCGSLMRYFSTKFCSYDV